MSKIHLQLAYVKAGNDLSSLNMSETLEKLHVSDVKGDILRSGAPFCRRDW